MIEYTETLSEKDLEIRGPGDFFGVEQHGLPNLKIADLYADTKILKMTSEAAKEILERYKDFEGKNEVRTPLLVYELDREYFQKKSPVSTSNESLQKVVVRKQR